MKKSFALLIATATVALLSRNWIQSAPLQSAAAPASALTSFRIVFGEKQERSLDYSGSISLTAGNLVRITPWRFFGSDAVQGANQWKLTIKRTQFESQPDEPRPLSTPGQMPMLVPAGVVVTVDAPATAIARVTTAQGPFSFRLVDLQDGHPLLLR